MIVTAKLKWADGQQFVGRIDEGSVLVIDTEEGGSGDGPMKLILMGVSGCAVMDVVSILKQRPLTFTGLYDGVCGERASVYPGRTTRIRIEFVVFDRDVKPPVIQQFLLD